MDSLARDLGLLGLAADLIDLRFVTGIARQCGAIDGEALNVADPSLQHAVLAGLVGFALGTGKPLVIVTVDGNCPIEIADDAVNLCVADQRELEAEVARLLDRMAQTKSIAQDRVGLFAAIDPAEPVAIVCAEIPLDLRPPYARPEHRDFLRYAAFADIDALILLMVWFSASKHRAVQAYTSTDLPENVFSSHILVVGGPAWNRLARSLYGQVRLPIDQIDGGPGNPDPIVAPGGTEKWLPEFRDDQVLSDVGFVAQVPSPFQPDRTVTMFGGILTHGVEAAVKAFTSPQVRSSNWAIVRALARPPSEGFCVVFRTRVVLNTNVISDFRQPEVLLAAYSCIGGVFVRVETS